MKNRIALESMTSMSRYTDYKFVYLGQGLACMCGTNTDTPQMSRNNGGFPDFCGWKSGRVMVRLFAISSNIPFLISTCPGSC